MNWADYPNFSREDFKCKCGCGRADMTPEFMKNLHDLRILYGYGMPVHSGFRCDDYNDEIGGGIAHPTGNASDIGVYGARCHLFLKLAFPMFTGIGIYQDGLIKDRFIHLDTLGPPHPRPRVWTYG